MANENVNANASAAPAANEDDMLDQGNAADYAEIVDRLAEGLDVERACMTRTQCVYDAFREIRQALVDVGERMRAAVARWESVRDTPEITRSGRAGEIDENVMGLLRVVQKKFPELARTFEVPDEAAEMAVFHRNVSDMTELMDALRLKARIDAKARECRQTERIRRRPLYRELRRMYQTLAGSCPSILHGKYESPNVDPEMANAVYRYVRDVVETAKDMAARLKAVC